MKPLIQAKSNIIYVFVDNLKKVWGTFDNKLKAEEFLAYIKTLKNPEDFTVIKYSYNGITNVKELLAVIPVGINNNL